MNKAILCVDDEAIILSVMQKKLQKYFTDRVKIYSALNAESALELINDLHAKEIQLMVVIADYLMPGMRGDEFLLKVGNNYPWIKSIMVTGMAEKEIIEDLRSRKIVKAVFYKPWLDDELFSTVEECMDF